MVEAYEKTYYESRIPRFQFELDEHFSTPSIDFVANP